VSAVKLLTFPIDYGKRCAVCKQVKETLLFRVDKNNYPIGSMRVCYGCLQKSPIQKSIDLPKEDNPIRRRERQKQNKLSRKLEEQVAEDVGGRAQPGSGGSRIKGFKGDIRRMGSWLMEHKFTKGIRGWTLRLGDLAKIVGLATEAGEYPALIIDFVTAGEAFAVIPYALFLEMIRATDKDQGSKTRKPGRHS